MGKASSAKKVARAARAGGSRRPGQRRQIGFPLLIAGVVIAGSLLVFVARDSREGNAAPRSQANEEFDHWHASLGINQCGEWLFDDSADGGPFLTDTRGDALGIHTHQDGVIHIHPFTDAAGGRNARMRLFFDEVGITATDSRVTFPDGREWDESQTTCTVDGEEVPGQIVLARWNSAQDAADGERPSEIITDDFGGVRFRADREYFTFAFVPEGDFEDIPVAPDIIESLGRVSPEIDAPSTTLPEGDEGDEGDGDEGDGEGDEGDGGTTTTTAEGDATTTTVAGDATTTTTG